MVHVGVTETFKLLWHSRQKCMWILDLCVRAFVGVLHAICRTNVVRFFKSFGPRHAVVQNAACCMLVSLPCRSQITNFFFQQGNCGFLLQGRIREFGQGGPEPKICKKRGFPLKLPENCMILKKYWGQGGQGSRVPPGSASALIISQPFVASHVES